MNKTGKGGFQDHPELINRDGRGRDGTTITDKLLEYSEQKIKVKVDKQQITDTRKAILAMVLWNKALGGDMKAVDVLMRYCDGLPKQMIELSGQIGTDINMRVAVMNNKELQKHIKDRLDVLNGSEN